MTDKEKLIELLLEPGSMCDPGDCGECLTETCYIHRAADRLIANGLVFKDRYEDMKERIAHQRARAQMAENFICGLCEECETAEHDGVTIMHLKCCSSFQECGKFKLRFGWIPVSERLPEVGKNVLVYGSRGGVYTAYLSRGGECPSWHKLNSKSHYCNPTYWMLLPKPPKEVV